MSSAPYRAAAVICPLRSRSTLIRAVSPLSKYHLPDAPPTAALPQFAPEGNGAKSIRVPAICGQTQAPLIPPDRPPTRYHCRESLFLTRRPPPPEKRAA